MSQHAPTFGDLRSLCQEKPTETSWRALCQTIDRAFAEDELQDEVRDGWHPYIAEHIESWPARVRHAPSAILRDFSEGNLEVLPPSLGLSQSFSFSWVNKGAIRLFGGDRVERIRALRFYQIDKKEVWPLFEVRPDVARELTSLELEAVFFDEDLNNKFIEVSGESGKLEYFFADGGHPNLWLRAFANQPESFSSLRELKIKSTQRVGSSDLRGLAKPGILENLEELDLLFVDLDSDSLIQALAAMPSLKKLALRAHDLSDSNLIRVLDEAALWGRLEKLYVGLLGMTEAQVAQLGARIRESAPNLKWFGFHTAFSEYGGGSFPKLETLGALPTSLEVARVMFLMGVAVDLDTLFVDGYAPRELRLGSSTRDGDMLARTIARLDLSRVEVIDLKNSVLGPERLAPLFTAEMPELRGVRLDSCKLGDEGLEAIMDSPWFSQLHKLELENNQFTQKHLPRLAKILETSALRDLNLDSNREMGIPGFKLLLEAASTRTHPLRIVYSIVEDNYIKYIIPERDDGTQWPGHIVFR